MPSRVQKNRKLDEKGFLKRLETAVSVYYDFRKEYDHVLIIAHVDADGYASCEIIEQMLRRDNIPHSYKFFNRNSKWDIYLSNILPEYDKFDNFAVFFVDIGSEIEEIANVFAKDVVDVFILDHHEIKPYDPNSLPENFFVINPTEFGYDGLKEIAGSTLSYLFAKKVSHKNINNAWIALIGISNDTLMKIDDYVSFNLEVLEDAISEEQILVKDGLFVYGGTHEKLYKALSYSLFPYIIEVEGSSAKAEQIIKRLGIDPKKNVEYLTDEEVAKINSALQEDVKGKYIIFPKKKGIVRYAFEHGLLLSISHYKFHKGVKALIARPNVPADYKKEYDNYVSELTKNLSFFVNTPKTITKHAIFVDADKRMNVNYWSDVASFASINNLFSHDKVLFLGGPDNNQIKLSVRCSEEFLRIHNGKGTNNLIQKLKKRFYGIGGGHKLASGYRIAPSNYSKLKKEIDKFFPL
ncbi:MAG: DHH family phosphoesterase [Promethearchaeota archaeon]